MNKEFKRIVIKVGTSTITDASGSVDKEYISLLASQIASLRAAGAEVLLVSSGAIRAGMDRMGMTERPTTIPEKQAAAAVGQGILMQIYLEAFERQNIPAAQVLLTREDFGDRRRYLNARNTMLSLFHHGAVPIVNENDTVAIDELKVGDNDNLAALVASNLEADLLILLSDVPGLYNANPLDHPDAAIIPTVAKIDSRIRSIAGGTGSSGGTGGMRTKVEAAVIAVNSGVTMVIADGRRPGVIADVVSEKGVGTTFVAQEECLCSRKRWIAFGAAPRGAITVNEGAKRMIHEKGKSLLAAGITAVSGRFHRGDLVKILDAGGNQFARGFVNYGAGEIDRIKGKHSSEFEEIIGHLDFDEIIHRDNMVLRS